MLNVWIPHFRCIEMKGGIAEGDIIVVIFPGCSSNRAATVIIVL